jgi:hypothetical protein
MASGSIKRSSRRSARAPRARNPTEAKAAGHVTTMQSTNTSDNKGKRAARKGQPAQESDAYETWLDHRLKSLYQPMLEAPLPADMMKLLRTRKSE